MCQPKPGKRCDVGRKLSAKKGKAEYIASKGEEVPEALTAEIAELETEHQEREIHMQQKEEKRQKTLQENAARTERRKLREERKAKEAEVAARKASRQKPAATKPAQLYMTVQEANQLRSDAFSYFLADKVANGELDTFLDTAAQRKSEKEGFTYTPYAAWSEENGDSPEGYLAAHNLSMSEAGKLTRERVYDGVRSKIEGPLTLTQEGDKAISGEFVIPQGERAGIPGRLPSNFGNQGDSHVRSEKTDIMLTEKGHQRVERLAQVFGISKGDVLRNQAQGLDHRVRQHHQGVAKYNERKAVIAAYEKEGGEYRKPGEKLAEFYERLIADESISLIGR